MKYIFLVILIIAAWVLFKPDHWTGYYYPGGCLSCEDQYIYSPEFNSKAQCLDWANDIAIKRNDPEDDFECGLNCKEKDGFNVCKVTVDS